MAANEGTTMTVQAMGRMLGLKKTESLRVISYAERTIRAFG